MSARNPLIQRRTAMNAQDACMGLKRLLGSDEATIAAAATTATLTITTIEDVRVLDLWINQALNDGAAAPCLASVPRVTALTINGVNMIQSGGVPVDNFDPNNPRRLRIPICELGSQQSIIITITSVDPTGVGATRAFAAGAVCQGQEHGGGSCCS